MAENILITGGAGFIGSHLAEHLIREGEWQVTIVDDLNDFYDPGIKRANLKAIQSIGNFQFSEVDIRDPEETKNSFRRDGIRLHRSSWRRVRALGPRWRHRSSMPKRTINGTLNLLELARDYEVPQFVFGSSSSVYGINSKVPFAEDDRIHQTISPYAATKAAGELLCHTYSHLFDIRCVCLRFFTVYGARQRPDLAIHKFARLITDGKPIQIFGDGTTRRDYTYIDDIISGVFAAMDYDGSKYEIFNLGESETTELSRLVELLEQNLDMKAEIDRQPLQPGDVPSLTRIFQRPETVLSYNPQTKIEDGIPKFVEWFRTTF